MYNTYKRIELHRLQILKEVEKDFLFLYKQDEILLQWKVFHSRQWKVYKVCFLNNIYVQKEKNMQQWNNSNSKNEKERVEVEKIKQETEELKDEKIEKFGQVVMEGDEFSDKIHLLTIIGEIEGHENLPSNTKSTKYEHILPQLASIESSKKIEGVLILINTVGGDVSAGLALAEMIASLSKPTVSLVIGDSHSIGVPLAVATDYSFIVPSGTMIIHPVRMSGTVIGAPQTYDYFKLIQDRIVSFIAGHSETTKQRIEDMMLNTGILTKDLGTILVGEEAVKAGIINEVGGIQQAMKKIHEMIEK